MKPPSDDYVDGWNNCEEWFMVLLNHACDLKCAGVVAGEDECHRCRLDVDRVSDLQMELSRGD